MKMINWKVRLKNPIFYLQILLAVISPVLAYTGITASEISSWNKLIEVAQTAIRNPYVVFLVFSSVYNAVIDPTTKGVKDSERAKKYTHPM